MKVRSSGKAKPSRVGTSDKWYDFNMEKEKQKTEKEEQTANMKKLQEETKKLSAEKKLLNQKVKDLAKEEKKEISTGKGINR